MKKLLIALALVPMLFACDRLKRDDASKADTSIPTFTDLDVPFREDAMKFDVPQKAYNEINPIAKEVKTVEFTETGVAIVEFTDKTLETTYEVESKDGKKTFVLKDLGKLELDLPSKAAGDLYKAVFDLSGIGKGVLSGYLQELAKIALTEFAKAACRDWKVEETDVKVTGSGAGLDKTYKGCNLEEIANDLKAQNININVSKVAGYVVKSISFTCNKTFKVNFTAKETYFGSFDEFASNGAFKYTFNGSEVGNPLINGQGTGTVGFRNGKLVLQIDANIEDGGSSKKYDTKVSFHMVPIKQ